MEVFILACLTACLLFSLAMACIQLIKMEKNLLEITMIVERKVTKLYYGD